MRVCIISHERFPFRGADTEVLVRTAAALGRQGADVELLAPHQWHLQRSMRHLAEYYGVEPTFRFTALPNPLPPERVFKLNMVTHGLIGPVVAAVRARADVVHTRDPLALLLAHGLRLPFCFETYRRHSAEKPWLKQVTRRIGFSRALGAVAHSELARRDLVELGFPEEATIVARPGANPAALEEPIEAAEARRSIGIPEGGPVIAYVGNIAPTKGVIDLLTLLKRAPDLRGLVVGGTPDAVHTLHQEALRLGVSDRLFHPGHRPSADVHRYLSAADVLIIPSVIRRDAPSSLLPGIPLKVYAYFAAARPVVAADEPQNLEVMRHEDTALLFSPGDEEGLEAQVRRALDDKRLRKKLVASGRAQVLRDTYDERARLLLDLYERRLA